VLEVTVPGFQIEILRMKFRGLLVLILFLVFPVLLKAQPWADSYSRAGRRGLTLPQGFEQYSGPDRIDYVSSSRGYRVYLSSGEVRVTFRGDGQPPETVRIRFAGSNQQSPPEAEDPLPGVIHYYVGNDPRFWRADVHRFQRVRYRDLYPGTDLLFYCERQVDGRRQLEFDFDVAPGHDPSMIAMKFEGATARLDNGNLEVVTPSGRVAVLKKPELYQLRDGRRQPVTGSYAERGPNQVGFAIADYDRSLPLVIDPALAYSTVIQDLIELTLLAGQFPPGSESAESDLVTGAVADSPGNLYLTGIASVPDPTQPAFLVQAFVIKLDPTGSHLLYTAYLGGNASNITRTEGNGIAIDAAGNAYIAGITNSATFATTPGVFNRTPACPVEDISNTDCREPFVAKFDPTGHLIFSTLTVAGSPTDTAGPGLGIQEIAIDSSGAIYTGGQIFQAQVHFPKLGTQARETPLTTTAGAFQTARKNDFTAYVTKVHPDGTRLDYSTYLGGSVGEFVTGMAIDSTGVAYLGGGTSSADFPVTPGAFQTTNPGTSAFFAKLKPDGSGLLYSTILGATGIATEGDALTIDSSNNAYLSGVTSGPGFPTTPGVFNPTVTTTADRNFVSKFDPAGNLAMSTYIGEAEFVVGISVDSTGIYAGGVTFSPNYPLLNSMQPAGSPFGTFVTKLDPAGSSLIYSTLAGNGSPQKMSIDGQQNVYFGGIAGPSFATTVGAFQTTPAAFGPFFSMGFATKIVPSLGAAVPTIEPRGISFPDVLQQGVSSAPVTVLVTNWGDVDVGLGSIAISGANAGDFSETNICGATLTVANNCAISVVFTPSVGEGVRTATITVAFGGNFPAQTVSLTGRAGTPKFQINPATFDFGTIGDSAFVSRSYSWTNVGTGPLTLLGATITPPPANTNPFRFGAAPFLQTLPPGFNSIPFTVEMLIPTPGPQSGQLIITDNTPDSPHVFNLTGFGFHVAPDFALATPGLAPATATVTAGQTASYDVLIAAVRTFSAETIAFTCSGAPAGATCSTSPTSMAADFNTQHIFISVKTTAASASLRHNAPAWPWAAMAVAAVVCMRPRRRKLIARMAMVCAVGMLGSIMACGGGSGNGGGPPGIPTPPGTYSLTLTATSTPTLPGSPPSVTHTLPLTLVVK
jgi:beta-propeller repeat-containing protein